MRVTILILSVLFISCGNKFQKLHFTEVKNIKGKDTCDSPDAEIACNFINAPENPGNILNLISTDEPGLKISIKGSILKKDGINPYPGILIYAFQTDDTGIYTKKGNETGVQKWHGRLHGWCKTDEDGKYIINTIKPGKYPSNDIPAHIHWAICEPDRKMQYLNDFVFSDDEHVNDEYISKLNYIGDNGVLTLFKTTDGIMTAERITVLK